MRYELALIMEPGKPDRIGLVKIKNKTNDKRRSNTPNDGTTQIKTKS